MKDLSARRRSLIVLASLSLALTADAEITKGVQRDQVIRELGEPTGKMVIGNSETLIYRDGKEISLKDGRVEQILVRSPRTNSVSTTRTSTSTTNRNKAKATEDNAAPKTQEDGRALVTLMDDTQIELITKTMYVYRGLTTSQTHSLDLPNGLRIPFKEIKSITIDPAADKSFVTIHVKRLNGIEATDKVKEPWINIVGDNPAGRFTKAVNEIKSIDFTP